MKADLSPASIFNKPSPSEKLSLSEEPVILKSTTTSSSAILDKCTFILRAEAVLGPLELIVQNSTIGSSTKFLSSGSSIKSTSGSSTKSLSGSVSLIVLTESIILFSKLTLNPCRDDAIIRLESTLTF